MRTLLAAIPFVLCLPGCSDSGGGGPAIEINLSPELTVPADLSGGPVNYSYALPTTGSAQLTFAAIDPEESPLLWQVSVAPNGQARTGLQFASPATGSTFTITIDSVTDAAATTFSVLVEDADGGAAAVDILLVRTGAPGIDAIEPDTAFATAGQVAKVTGSAFELGGSVTTFVSVGGSAATTLAVENETTITCITPTGLVPGDKSVGVSNAFGSSALPVGAFTMLAYPVDLLDQDVALSAGAASQLAAAQTDASIHAVWVEGGDLVYSRSDDAGASWSATMPLTSGETVDSARIAAVGDDVTVAWRGMASQIRVRSSDDNGATFATAASLGSALFAPVPRLQLVASADYRYLAWLSGDQVAGNRRVWCAASDDAGASWGTAVEVGDVMSNQLDFSLGCEGNNAWVGYSLGSPEAIYSTRTADAGATWSAGQMRSAPAEANLDSRVWSCNVGARVYLVYNHEGLLRFVRSEDAGATWSTSTTALGTLDEGVAGSSVAVACEDDRLYAVYNTANDVVVCSRIGAVGALAEHVVVSATQQETGGIAVHAQGNYVVCAWRGGSVGGGTGDARVTFATSVDLGLTFADATGFGDGTAAQEQPVLLQDSARLWLGWLDYRNGPAQLFQNRSEQ